MNAVEVHNVSVRYKPLGDGTPTLRRIIAAGPRKRHEVAALNDVSFNVEVGEAFGIIGRNGAGKSTLMRVLARTLRPDEGTVRVQGETSTLLQLGVGFNPQLSGRRNVYLGALAMGMSREEVEESFESIVGFAELQAAIERPLKTYSSGMTARLAFSISMHMRPSIFLVDEVLAVGDDHFRRKSMAAMEQMLDDAGTIVFVSHALERVRRFCDRVMWLDHGKVRAIGDPADVVNAYRKDGQ